MLLAMEMADSPMIVVLSGILAAHAGRAAEPAPPALARHEFHRVEMAVPIRIVLYTADAAAAERAATAAFDRMRQLNAVCSDYDETSELRRLCATAGGGRPVRVSDELWQVFTTAQDIAAKSEGAFDITCGPLVQLWRRARRQKELPSADRLQVARQLVDYRAVQLVPAKQAVELLKPNMRLDLGGIAKGYVVHDALRVLRAHGVTAALVEAGGDLGLGDPPPGRPGWRIGIGSTGPQQPPRMYLCLARTAVATSGDMWQFVTIGGQRYSHIVDPRTGVGLTDHSSVTAVAEDGATADALSTAVSVLGPEKGLTLVESLPGAAAFIQRNVDGQPATYASKRWSHLPVDAEPDAP
jgi:thiamine biosynthesis lipoprotein